MVDKSSDIIDLLKENKPRQVLKPSQQALFDKLVYTGLMDESGNQTTYGKKVLKDYAEKTKKYQPGSVELAIVNSKGAGKYTYEVMLTRNPKERPAKKPDSSKKVEETPSKQTDILTKYEAPAAPKAAPVPVKQKTVSTKPKDTEFGNYVSSLIKDKAAAYSSTRRGEGGTIVNTNLVFGRTTEEINRLNEIAQSIGAEIQSVRNKPKEGEGKKKGIYTDSVNYFMKGKEDCKDIAVITSEKILATKTGNISKNTKINPLLIEIRTESKETTESLLNALRKFKPIPKKSKE